MAISVDNDGMTYHDPDGYEVKIAYKWRNPDAFYDHLLKSLKNI